MSNKYFGTDGIRGAVNQGNITGEKFFKFGLAAATYFKNQKKTKQIAIIAKDTRLSGYTLEPALVSGLVSGGLHVFTLGPLPTNGLAMLTKSMKANMGIMITASHNPNYDNGLKLFGPDGMKLSDQIEKKIENIENKKNELKQNINSLSDNLEESKKAETILSTYKIKNESQLDEIVAEIKMKTKQMQKIPLTVNSGQLVEAANLDSHAKTIYENIVSLEKSTKGFDQQEFLKNIESRASSMTRLTQINQEYGEIS